MRLAMRCKQIGPIDVNGGIHTARKQYQRKNVRIYARVASRVLRGLGLACCDGIPALCFLRWPMRLLMYSGDRTTQKNNWDRFPTRVEKQRRWPKQQVLGVKRP